jgi:hypothetical protein
VLDIAALENLATVSRTTAGIYKYHRIDAVAQDQLARYTRDVHSPAIARRAGIHLYRHFSYGPIRTDLFRPVEGVAYDCPDSVRLTGAGHLDYLDQSALEAFYASPNEQVRDLLLADINVIGGPPGRTTTYRTSPGNGRTFIDVTGEPAPQGPGDRPRYAILLRQRGDQDSFRAAVRLLARRWSSSAGVLRVRMQLFDVPDMAVESLNGYPVYPAPVDEHYQAWIDLVLDADEHAAPLIDPDDATDYSAVFSELHVQPVPVVYTYVWAGRPTVVGLRGYPAWELITALGATNQQDPALLEWMYGPIAGRRLP